MRRDVSLNGSGAWVVGLMMQPRLIQSTPALAAALRTMDQAQFIVAHGVSARADRLAPMYQLPGDSVADEAPAAAHLISHVAERLRRLAAAYAEWDVFDAPAYFDLDAAQADALVRVVERVSTVHVVFFADLLLPSFKAASCYWATTFAPAYVQMRQDPAIARHVHDGLEPVMLGHWQRLWSVIQQARAILSEDVGFLAANGAADERNRWQPWWRTPPRPGLDARLAPTLAETPTLTLTLDFALPAHRQPGRLRRLRAHRERRQRERRGRTARR